MDIDGYRWIIETISKTYSPVNLDNKYQENGLSVDVEFKKLSSKFYCGLHNTSLDEIKISDTD